MPSVRFPLTGPLKPRVGRWFLLPLLAALCGCHGGLHIPPGWRDVGNPPTDDPSLGRMQVILCFGTFTSNHSAVRLECPGRAPILWDPGGMWGKTKPEYKRSRDIVYARVPTIDEWWIFRRDA